MRVRVFTGSDGLVFWQACITKKTRRQTPPCAKRRTRRSGSETNFRESRMGTPAVTPVLANTPNQDDSPRRANIKSTRRLKLERPHLFSYEPSTSNECYC